MSIYTPEEIEHAVANLSHPYSLTVAVDRIWKQREGPTACGICMSMTMAVKSFPRWYALKQIISHDFCPVVVLEDTMSLVKETATTKVLFRDQHITTAKEGSKSEQRLFINVGESVL